MSVESARACLRRLVEDSELMAQVRAAAGPPERRAVVHNAGYEFTLSELAEARSLELSDEESLKIDLADEELDAVTGGAHCGYTHEGSDTTHCGWTHEAEHNIY